MTRIEKKVTSLNPHGTYWIIVNRKRGSIWKGTFLSYEAALSEMRYQVAALKSGQTHGFVIEKVDSPGGIVQARDRSKKDEVDSLDRLAAELTAGMKP